MLIPILCTIMPMHDSITLDVEPLGEIYIQELERELEREKEKDPNDPENLV